MIVNENSCIGYLKSCDLVFCMMYEAEKETPSAAKIRRRVRSVLGIVIVLVSQHAETGI